MNKHKAANERIKREYLRFLKEAKQQSEATVDAVASTLARFESYTNYKDFKTFRVEQAIGFKKHLAATNSETSGDPLSKATMHAILAHLKRFFEWLAREPGYKSRVKYSDAEYFNMSEKDTRVAKASQEMPFPTIAEVKHVIKAMPSTSEIERRDRALIAFTLLTGARASAIASLKLKHIDISAGKVYQDAREVKTKFSKSFETVFFPVGEEVHTIFAEWVVFLRDEKFWGNNSALFPATEMRVGADKSFEVAGLKDAHWSTASPIRGIFRNAFEMAGLPYFNPHSFRKTLGQLGETLCHSPEEFKAWSQNLGHEDVLTTFNSYGEVAPGRQREVIKQLAHSRSSDDVDTVKLYELMKKLLEANGAPGQT